MTQLKREAVDVAFLQETHLTDSARKTLKEGDLNKIPPRVVRELREVQSFGFPINYILSAHMKRKTVTGDLY